MKFSFIAAEKTHYPVRALCKALEVSPSGFYASQHRAPSARATKDLRLKVLIRTAFEQSRQSYGSPRIYDDVAHERVGRNRVIRLMQAEGIRARHRRRYRMSPTSDPNQAVAANVLARDFVASAPNQRWVADTTELRTPSGKFYLAAILDLYSRCLVGWAIRAVNDRHLILAALDAAIIRRRPASGLLHHSDQGCTYTSEDYQDALASKGITASMSRRGNCYDNAVIESWFSTLKFELGETFESIGDAKKQLFDYIDVFYNQKRRHSKLGGMSPAHFERMNAINESQAALSA